MAGDLTEQIYWYVARKTSLRKRTLLILILAFGTTISASGAARAQTSPNSGTATAADTSVPQPPTSAPASESATSDDRGLLGDIELYYTAPLRWTAGDWAWFGGALVAIGASHHFDSQVRTHFTQNLKPGQTINSDGIQDIIPTVAVLGVTWGYSYWIGDPNGERESWAMLEAAGLSTVTAYAFKFIARREGPDQTDDPNEWFKSGGRSFPSDYATAAFAVGAVLAESGNDDYRWVRRFLGYGLGIATSYLRLEHNAHWLSDTVAGAALGISTAYFTMGRTYRKDDGTGLAVEPVPGGAILTYRINLP